MKCIKCGSDSQTTSKFCPSCGEELFSSKAKSPSEVTTDWIMGVLEKVGYKKHPDIEEEEDEAYLTHEEYYNLSLSLKRDKGLISMKSLFSMEKPGWGKRTEELECMNVANGVGHITTFFLSEENNTLGAYSFIPLNESITERDVLSLVEIFKDEVLNGLEISKLTEFSK